MSKRKEVSCATKKKKTWGNKKEPAGRWTWCYLVCWFFSPNWVEKLKQVLRCWKELHNEITIWEKLLNCLLQASVVKPVSAVCNSELCPKDPMPPQSEISFCSDGTASTNKSVFCGGALKLPLIVRWTTAWPTWNTGTPNWSNLANLQSKLDETSLSDQSSTCPLNASC